MPALVSKKFRLHNAKQFVEAFDEDIGFTPFANTVVGDVSLETNMYLFIGGISAWTDDSNPDTPTDSIANSYYTPWRDMIAAKKITPAEVTHCISRNNWVNNTAYFAYTHAENDLYAKSFHVMTDEYNVYKCVANTKTVATGGNSTAKPTGTGTSIITPSSDGYKWKYMYTISASQALKFSTSSYIPTQQIRHANAFGQSLSSGMPTSTQENEKQRAVEVAAVDGAVNLFKVTSAGTNHEFVNQVLSGSQSTTVFGIEDSGASTTADFYVGSDIYFTGTEGTAAGTGGTITASVGTGGAKTVTIGVAVATAPTAGDPFTIAPKVVITGDGHGATARAVGTNSTDITEILAVTAGNSYSNAVVTITQAPPGISVTNGEATAMIEPKGGHGYDATEELGGFNVMINSRLENDESGDFTVANDFRKIGLLSQPLLNSDSSIATVTTADQATTVTLQTYSSTVVDYVQDQLVTGALSGATGRVIDATISGATGTLRLTDVTHGTTATNGFDGIPGSFQANEVLSVAGADPTANTNGVVGGDLKQFSGDILYVEHRSPVTRASDQIEDVKLIINF